MSRETGFAVVDLDVGILHDPKVIKLARAIRDEERTAAHIGLYVALLAESWRTGERVRLEDALPAWWMAEVEQFAEALRDAGLIDAEDRIPERSWSGWFGPAFKRRQDRQREGRISGLVSHGMTREQAEREADRRSSQGETEVTSGLRQGRLDPFPSPRPADHPTRPTGRGSSTTTPLESVVVDLPDDETPRRALARAIREANNDDLRERHLSRFEGTYGHLYPRTGALAS